MRRELFHHGIKGQKWGKRNGPPYPLKRHSVSERKALDKANKKGYNKDRAIERGRYAVGSILGKIGDTPISELSADSLTKNIKMLPKPESVEEVLRNTNPSKSHNNCFNCVVAATARLCGLDVTAKEGPPNGHGVSFDEVCRVFKLDTDNPNDVVRILNPDINKVMRQIGKRYSEGDVGAIGFAWSDEFRNQRGVDVAGHTLNWVIQKGKPLFIDAQICVGNNIVPFIEKNFDANKEFSIAKFANINDKSYSNIDTNLFNKFVK